jgi:hypothetical protein
MQEICIMKRFLFPFLFVFIGTNAFGQTTDSIAESWDLRCFPNPTSDFLIITSSLEIKEITFIDLSGQVLKVAALPNNCFSLHDFPSGWIFVYIETTDGRVEKKNIYKQ